MIPKDLRYTDQHTWLRPAGDTARFGVTEAAVAELGELVYIELPEVGASFSKGQSFGVIESTKAVYDLLSPVSGKVVALNQATADDPDVVAGDPFGKGWMIELSLSDPSEVDALMSPEDYAKKVEAD